MCGPLVPEICNWLSDLANIATIIGVILGILALRAAQGVWPNIVNFFGSEITAVGSTVANRGSMSGPSIRTEGSGDVHINVNNNQSMTKTDLEIEED